MLNGRNRLDALELLGEKIFDAKGELLKVLVGTELKNLSDKPDCYAHVISLNVRRRHLRSQQKRELIAMLLKLDPEKSNLQIAKTVDADDKTVASVRADPRSEIPNVATRTDTKGRKQPAAKTIKVKVRRWTEQIVAPYTRVESGGPPKMVNLTISPDNSGERKQVNAAAVPDGAEQRTQEDNTTFDHQSRHALAEFKYACKAYLPKMNAAHRQEAIGHVASIVAKIDKAAP